MARIGGATAQGTVEIFFRQVGLRPLNAQVNSAFANMRGRSSYYVGMMQARLGYAFLAMSAAITAFGVLSVKTFAEFDQAMMNTASVTGATTEQMEFLRDVAKDLGKIGTASAKDVADAMYFLGSAGYNVQQIFQAIEPIMKLAVATQADMADVARITMQSLKAFGKEAKDATHFAQVFAAGISTTQLRIEWLGQSMKHVGPVAREMGMSIEDTVAILGMLHDAGIQAGMAGRHLRRILQGTVKDTPQVTSVLEKLGLRTQDISIQMHGFEQVMKNLNKSGATLGDVFKMFGLRASASAAVLKRQAMVFGDYLEKVKDAAKLQAMFNKQMQGLQAQFKRLANTFGVWMMTFAKSYVPLVRRIVKALTGIIDVFSKFPPWIHMFAAILGATSALTLAFLGLAMIMMGILTQGMLSVKLLTAMLIGSFKTAGIVVWNLTKALTIGLLHSIRNLTVAMVTGFVPILTKTAKGFKLVNIQLGYTNILAGRFLAVFIPVVKALLAVYAILVLGIAAWKNFGDSIKVIVDEILVWFETLKTGIKDIVDYWTRWFSKIRIPEALRKAIDFQLWLSGWKKGSEEVDKINADFNKRIEDRTETLRNAAKMTAKDIKEANRVLLDFIEKTWGKIFSQEKLDALKTAFSGVFGPLEDGLEDFKDKFEETTNFLGEKIETFKDKLEKTWTDTIFDLIKGTKSWLDVWHMVLDDALKTFIHGFTKKAVEAFADMVWDIHNLQAGMGKGFWGWAKDIGTALLGISKSGAGAVAGIQGGVGGTTQNVPWAGGQVWSPSFQKGINYVPKDMLAYLHKGERVTPTGENQEREITIVNVVDPAFVPASIARDPNIVINVINDDVIMAGSTRRTFRRYLR